MSSDTRQAGFGGAGLSEGAAPLESIRAAFTKADETERYRMLAALLSELADISEVADDGRTQAATQQAEALSKRLQALGEEKADLNDSLAAARADLANRKRQHEAEQARAEELQRIVEDQRGRLSTLQKQLADVEAQLDARTTEHHRLEVENERLLLDLQRTSRDKAGQDRLDAAEQRNRQLTQRTAELEAELERLRTDKGAEIERIQAELTRAQSEGSVEGEAALAPLWERLAHSKPPFAPLGTPPNAQAGERLVDAFIELVRFVDDFDKSMRVFLGKYTKHHASVKVPWDVYAKKDDVYKTAQQTVAPQGGKPVALLKMRLRVFYAWAQAAMIGCDSAIESIASALHTYLMSDAGCGSDPNRKIKDFLRDDGHELFLQQIRELRSEKLAEAFGRGG